MKAVIIALAVSAILFFCISPAICAEPADKVPYKIGDEFPDFELPNLAGENTKSAGLKAGKFLIIRFRFPPSEHPMFRRIAEMDITEMNIIQDRYLGKAAVIDVVVKNPRKIEEILEEYEGNGVAYNVLVDADGAVTEKLKIKDTYIFVIGKDGKILGIFSHFAMSNHQAVLDEMIKD